MEASVAGQRATLSRMFATAAVGLFVLALLENWLGLGIAFPPLSVGDKSGLAVLAVVLLVPYYVSRKVESRRDTYY
jgi:hypothetical protein